MFLEIVVLSNCLHYSVFFYITDKKKYLSGVGSHRLQSEAFKGPPSPQICRLTVSMQW